MFTFITPLRAPQLAKNWDRTCKLFERTATSVFRQTSSEFRHIVVCHEPPELTCSFDERLQFICVDFPIELESLKFTRDIHATMSHDKVAKAVIGLQEARKQNAAFVMVLDGDDLVSNRLVAHVLSNPTADGWYVKYGWRYSYGRGWIVPSDEFNKVCGSCNVVSRRWFAFPEEPEREVDAEKMLIDQGHAEAVQAFAMRGAVLQPFPFRAVVATESGENTSLYNPLSINIRPRSPNPLRRLAGRINLSIVRWRNRRPLTAALRSEFSIDQNIFKGL